VPGLFGSTRSESFARPIGRSHIMRGENIPSPRRIL
jgi:hypothetical protein